ncbi:MAG: hypothetical protein JXX14_24190 [Deltaproteobacteria bacterium]|nr:hypothetical protein [Deltaproteobacteria bacterium]
MTQTKISIHEYSKTIVRLLIGAMIVASLSLSMGGCDSEDASTYDLTVRWNIGGMRTCNISLPTDQYAQDELQFGKVVVNIYEDETATKAVQAPVVVPCANMESKISRLPRDTYYVTVEAFATYMGEQMPFFQGASEVTIPATDDAINIPLTVGNGEILVFWTFAGGKVCGVEMAGEVANVAVRLNNGNPIVVPCGQGQLLLEDVPTDIIHTISADAYDASGNILYSADHLSTVDSEEFQVLPGQSYQAVVIFQ